MALGPRRTVTGPHGTWELYVSSFVESVAARREQVEYRRDEGYFRKDPLRREVEREQVETAAAGFARKLFGRARSQGAPASGTPSTFKIEAVNWDPPAERLVWTTTSEALDRVLDEIAEGFEQGKVVQPAGAVYAGAIDEQASPDDMLPP
jgi:hypothetical protein